TQPAKVDLCNPHSLVVEPIREALPDDHRPPVGRHRDIGVHLPEVRGLEPETGTELPARRVEPLAEHPGAAFGGRGLLPNYPEAAGGIGCDFRRSTVEGEPRNSRDEHVTALAAA